MIKNSFCDDRIKEDKTSRLIKILFYLGVIVPLIIFCVGNYITHGALFNQLFYKLTEDSGFDFYVFLSGSSVDKSVYTTPDSLVFNPPLIRVFMKFIFRGFPIEIQEIYRDSSIASFLEMDIRTVACAMLPFLLVFIITVTAIAMLYFYKKRGKIIEKIAFAFIAITCIGMIFAYERGNLIILAVFFATFFCMSYKSNNKFIKELGLISLAFASGIKIYPCFLGILLLKNKDYKAAIRTIIYGLIAILLPFVFFGGFEGILGFFSSLTGQANTGIAAGYLNMTSTFSMILRLLGNSPEHIMTYSKAIKYSVYIICMLGLLLSFESQEEWKSIALIVLTIISLSGTSHTYMLSFVPIIIYFFLEKNSYCKMDFIYLFLMICMISILPIKTGKFVEGIRLENERFTTLMIIQELSVLCMYFLLLISCFLDKIKYLHYFHKKNKHIL